MLCCLSHSTNNSQAFSLLRHLQHPALNDGGDCERVSQPAGSGQSAASIAVSSGAQVILADTALQRCFTPVPAFFLKGIDAHDNEQLYRREAQRPEPVAHRLY